MYTDEKKYRAYRIRTRGRRLALRKEWYARNKEKHKAGVYAWRKKNPDKYRAIDRASNKRRQRAKRLSDTYIKNVLTTRTKLKFADIPEWLVVAKRAQIILLRLINEKLQ